MHRTAVALMRRLAPVLVAALAAPAVMSAEYEVVLASGTRVPAASRPVIAMGKVSFLDESLRPVSFSAQEVDVEATRAAAGGVRARSRVWDEKSLAGLKSHRVQFYGEGPEGGAQAGGDAARAETPADPGGVDRRTAAEKLRDEIQGLGQQIRTLPTTDRQRSLLVIRQLELQQELTRVLSPARS